VNTFEEVAVITIGSRVTDRWGEPGVLSAVYRNFWDPAIQFLTMTREDWLALQTIPFSDDQLEEPWGQVICDSGGATMGPMSTITPED
jgi:hypothetical protein